MKARVAKELISSIFAWISHQFVKILLQVKNQVADNVACDG